MAKGFRINIDSSDFTGLLKNLRKTWSVESLTKQAAAVAEEIVTKVIDSPVPTDTGDLAGSGVVESDAKGGKVRFGFNKVYATFQDSAGRNTQTIRPIRKKFLYVPISQKGRRRHRVGRNPRDEGLVRGEDYVLRKTVRVATKPYGSPIGPNRYFTETINRNTEFFFEQLAARMDKLREKGS